MVPQRGGEGEGGAGRGSRGHAEAKCKGGQESPQEREGRKASQRDAEGSCTGPPRLLAFLTDGREWSLSPGTALRGSCQGPSHSLEAAASSYWPRSRGLERCVEDPGCTATRGAHYGRRLCR